jgi:hypothetical protein
MGALKEVTGAVGGLAGLRQMSVGKDGDGCSVNFVLDGEGVVSDGEVSANVEKGRWAVDDIFGVRGW